MQVVEKEKDGDIRIEAKMCRFAHAGRTQIKE